jgi:hypothetical protein
MSDEIHDFSRVDAYMRGRRRVAFLGAAWKPMLSGAAGAALVIAAVYVAMPKFSTREITVDHVVMRDVAVPNIVSRDVQVDHVVPHDVQVDRIVPHDVTIDRPVAAPPPATAPSTADTPKTPEEKTFTSTPEYESAIYRGRIIASRGGGALSFADGRDFFPGRLPPGGGRLSILAPDLAVDANAYVGDFGMCTPDTDDDMFECVALHNGREVLIPVKPLGKPA